jgi:hypothetical protein
MDHQQPLKRFKSDDQREDNHTDERAQELLYSEQQMQKLSAREALESPETQWKSGRGRDHSGAIERPRKL